MSNRQPPVLEIDNLRVEYPLANGGLFTAVENASLIIQPGEIHALVGESGAGKTTIGNAVMGLLEKPGRIASGSIHIGGKLLDPTSGSADGVVLGRDVGAVFQDPMTSLNPLFTVESQLTETLRTHLKMDRAASRVRALELMKAVGIPEPERRLKAYPHQLSGGQRQRVVIAAALSCDPTLVVADEPTTALDVSVQAQILKLLRDLADNRRIGILLVTHNMGVVAQIADRVTIMHRGKVVESGPTAEVLRHPKAEYAKALIGAVPRIDMRLDRFPVVGEEAKGRAADAREAIRAKAFRADATIDGSEILSVENLCVDYVTSGLIPGSKGHRFRAVDNVSFKVRSGEVFGLVGESGCGKTTIANVVAGLVKPTSGRVLYQGKPVAGEGGIRRVGPLRQAIQMIFQDPYSSLNSRIRIGSILAEPILFYRLAPSRAEAESDVAQLIEAVGLDADSAGRYAHAFSGGQRQRLSIARALGARPRLIVCDEPTSSLDVSVQAQILNLLKDLRDATGLTLLLISHDLAVVRQMCDRIAVMKSGKLVEEAAAEALFQSPQHPYTQELLSLVPTLDRIRGETEVA
ncbi:dipeptide ABC transporter ATP-binding protein [Microvirga brassicacearum]|uniref:ABC transporter ATP-binding protein n=1 Tax=Microvirga brassicacearum TaxID=2580413 RepID=A0A5N3PDB3_9HYPH|nr:ABC transporter ATP-binding protein [Microvirga brassicacearum]KAB0267683.1 ABC transporter ATP-binding protein [Microvirga brassicacearum]